MDTKCRKVKPGGETGLFFFLSFFGGGRAACCVAHSDAAPCHPLWRRPHPVPSGTPRNEHPLLSFPANSCGWKIPQHLQRAHPSRAQGLFQKHHSNRNRGSGSPSQGKPLWLPGWLSLLHHDQKLAAYTDLLTFSIVLGVSREREGEGERKSEVGAHFVFTSVPTT